MSSKVSTRISFEGEDLEVALLLEEGQEIEDAVVEASAKTRGGFTTRTFVDDGTAAETLERAAAALARLRRTQLDERLVCPDHGYYDPTKTLRNYGNDPDAFRVLCAKEREMFTSGAITNERGEVHTLVYGIPLCPECVQEKRAAETATRLGGK